MQKPNDVDEDFEIIYAPGSPKIGSVFVAVRNDGALCAPVTGSPSDTSPQIAMQSPSIVGPRIPPRLTLLLRSFLKVVLYCCLPFDVALHCWISLFLISFSSGKGTAASPGSQSANETKSGLDEISERITRRLRWYARVLSWLDPDPFVSSSQQMGTICEVHNECAPSKAIRQEQQLDHIHKCQPGRRLERCVFPSHLQVWLTSLLISLHSTRLLRQHLTSTAKTAMVSTSQQRNPFALLTTKQP